MTSHTFPYTTIVENIYFALPSHKSRITDLTYFSHPIHPAIHHPPSQHRQARKGLTRIILTILLLALAVFAAAPAEHETNPRIERRQEISVGSSCAGAEGQWNCMTNSFQRCGSGQWSEVQQCALGTKCSPSGLTYQFHVDFADGYLGAAPPPPPPPPPQSTSGGTRIGDELVGRWLLSGLGLLTVMV